MGHSIRGIVFRERDAAALAIPAGWPKAVPLKHGFGLQPLLEEQLDELARAGAERAFAEHFTFLTAGAAEFLRARSERGALVYLETDYFGGEGEQAAVVFGAGRVIGEPESGTLGPINAALARLGVVRTGADDEFDTVGLGRYRTMDDFEPVELPPPLPSPPPVAKVETGPKPSFFAVKSPGWTPSAELARALCGASLLGWFFCLALLGCAFLAPGWRSGGWIGFLAVGVFLLHFGTIMVLLQRNAGKPARPVPWSTLRCLFGPPGLFGWVVKTYLGGIWVFGAYVILCRWFQWEQIAPRIPPSADLPLLLSVFYVIAAGAHGTVVAEARAALRAQLPR